MLSIRQAAPCSLFFALCPLLISPAFAQSSTAQEIETLLATPAVTYAQAARFVLEAADVQNSPPEEAFQYAADQNWLPKNAEEEGEARLDGIALLLMQSFDIKGGIFYSLTKAPRYAYRELAYQNIIQGRTDPAMNVDGDTLLFLVNRIFALQDEEAERQVRRTERKTERKTALQRISYLAREKEALAAEINTHLEENKIDASVRVTDRGVTINVSNIQFRADSAELTESEKARLGEIAQILKAIPGRRIQIAGHTALAGTETGQFTISLERAQSVAVYLVSLGVRRPGEITTVGYGSDSPIADNATAEGRAANRRVEITILGD